MNEMVDLTLVVFRFFTDDTISMCFPEFESNQGRQSKEHKALRFFRIRQTSPPRSFLLNLYNKCIYNPKVS